MISVVIPTLGRPSLTELLVALRSHRGELIVVDDRPVRDTPLPLPPGTRARIVPGPARGPAAARNAGWRAARHEWIAFLDDDVLPARDWWQRLVEDLAEAGDEVGGVQSVLRVPLPPGRRPTDWERVTAGLTDGAWITADMAYRRDALTRCGGFDERLPRAFREDADIAHRVRRAGFELRCGHRVTTHPVRPESPWVSLRTQRGNADDALLRRLYGPDWRTLLEVPPGRRPRHAAITAAAVVATAAGAIALAIHRRARAAAEPASRRRGWAVLAGLAATAWAGGTAGFAAARIVPGPRDRREVTTMLATSVLIPPAAVAHWLRGCWKWRNAEPLSGAATASGLPPGASDPAERAGNAAAPRSAAGVCR